MVARDAGAPAKSSLVTVYIDVQDANDNQPLFDPASFYWEVRENATPLTRMLQNISATDLDAGELMSGTDPPENCHLTVKKLPKT